VQQAAFTTILPLGPSDATMTFSIPPRSSAGDPVRITTGIRVVSPGYFETMGIQLLAGRFFSSSDVATSQAVLVVNRAFAEKYADIGGAGQQVPVSMYGRDAWQVAGVIENIRTRAGLTEPVLPEMFVVHSQVPTGLGGEPTFVVRTRSNPELLITPLRQIVAQADPSATIESVMTMERRVMESLSRPRLYAFVLAGFAGFALLLAGVGLFGVLSYSVTQRSRELGVRAALGARPRDIVRLVVREGLVITLCGAVAGIWTAVVVAGWLRSFLFGVSTYDPVTFVAVPAILLIVAALASFVPARRAAGADPLTVLKTN
jgi:predicted permease